MALNTNLNKAGPANFELVFPVLPVGTDLTTNRELSLNIYSTIIPGVSMDPEQLDWLGGRTNRAGGKLTFEQWNCNFLVDSELKNWKTIFNWLTYINNNYNQFMRSHRDYTVDATMRVVDNYSNGIFQLLFVDVWPNGLGEVTFSHRDAETTLECNILLAYDRYEIQDYQ